MSDSRFTLGKNCHLCGETTIARLYKEGRAFIVFPIRVVYLLEPRRSGESRLPTVKMADAVSESRQTIRVMFVAPKKRFRHAVDRNRYRRLMREAYRLNQHPLRSLLDEHNATMDISFVAVHNELPSFAQVEKCMLKIMDKLSSKISVPSQTVSNNQQHVD